MADQFTLTCQKGRLKGNTWTWQEAENIVLGRSRKCTIRFPAEDDTLSRFQSKIEIRPPKVFIRDYGSKNGTYVNEELIGRRESGMSAEEGRNRSYKPRELADGDIIRLGSRDEGEVFRLNILVEKEPEEAPVENDSDPIIEGINLEDFIRLLLAQKQEKNYDSLYEGKLRLKKELGRGGFGVVYLAEHIETGRQYAIKEIIPEVKVNRHNMNLFLREISIGRQLHHRNVIETLASGEKNGNLYFVMNYYSNGSVADLMTKKGGKLDLGTATNIMFQVLDGLDYIHNATVVSKDRYGKDRTTKGVVHRDMKPHNMLIDENGVVKISDLGLAKAYDLAGMSGISDVSASWGGTLAFAPRKQEYFLKVRPDVDVFGAVSSYYFMLTGALIRNFDFRRKNIVEQLLDLPVVPIEQRDPRIPPKLARVIDSVLAEDEVRDPKKCTTAKQLKQDIRLALNI